MLSPRLAEFSAVKIYCDLMSSPRLALIFSGNQKKKTRFGGLFFLCAFGAARLRRPPPPHWIARAHRPTSHSRLDRRCAYPRIALLIKTSDNGRGFRSGNVGLTHFLMKHLERSGNQKKKTHFVGLFFSLRLRRPPSPLDRPCAQAPAQHPTHDWINVAPIHV